MSIWESKTLLVPISDSAKHVDRSDNELAINIRKATSIGELLMDN
jgi:hypothetical protein